MLSTQYVRIKNKSCRYLCVDGANLLRGSHKPTSHHETSVVVPPVGQTQTQDLVGDSSSLTGEGAGVETFSTEIVKGVLPSRHVPASELQTGVPYFLRLAASNSLGFGEYGENVAVAKAAQPPAAPGDLSAGVALHVDEVSQFLSIGGDGKHARRFFVPRFLRRTGEFCQTSTVSGSIFPLGQRVG